MTTVWVVTADYGLNGAEAIAVFDHAPSRFEVDAVENAEGTAWTGYGGVEVKALDVLSRIPLTVVVAGSMVHFHDWRMREGRSPRDPFVIPLVRAVHVERLRGRRVGPGDRLIVVSPILRSGDRAVILNALAGAGFDTERLREL